MRDLHIILCTLGAAAVVAVLSIVRPGAIVQLDLRAYDELLRRTARPPTTGRVSIVAVDEKSIAEIGQWPWRRDVLAQLVERLQELGARVTAFDIILSEPDRLGKPRSKTRNTGEVASTTTDATLAAALAHQRTVTSYAFTFDAPAGSATSCVRHPLQAVQVAAPGQASPAHRLFQPTGVICSLPDFNVWALALWSFETRNTFLSPLFPTLSAALSLAVLTVAEVASEGRRAESEKRRRQQAHRFIVQSLTSLTETRDVVTGKHARRTQGYTRLVASLLAKSPRFRRKLTRETIELMAILAPLHDIGKIGIPDAVLNKPGPLTPDEYAQMRTHPDLGYKAIAHAEALSLIEDEEIVGLAKDMVFTHHEWWDGHGYPRGLAGEEIPIGGRILAVVDVYDALIAPRPYRVPMPHEQAVGIIRAQRGTHFDPDVVDAFVAAEHDIEALSKTLSS